MKITGKNRSDPSVSEWAIVLFCVAAAVLVSKVANISPKWEHATIYTILVFASVVVALRRAWRYAGFWYRIGVVFVLHCGAIIVITLQLPLESQGIRGIPLIAGSITEGLIIISVLWRSIRPGFYSPKGSGS